MAGWIKIHRKLQDWHWYSDSHMVHLFIHLLIEANHEDRKWRGQPVKRGQLIYGRKVASETLGISEQSLRTCMERLKSTKEITIKSTSHFSLVTIVNYEDYQSLEEISTSKSTKQSTYHQPATNQPLTTPKELKKERIKEINTKVFITPAQIEIEDYILKDLQNVPIHSIKELSAEFFDYYTSKGWLVGKAKMKDWKAAVRNWIRNDKKFNGQKNGNGNTNTTATKPERIGRMAKRDVEEFLSRPIINDIMRGPSFDG